MSFVSLNFFLFTAASALVYFAFPKKLRWAVLLAASMIFYLLCSGVLVVCLLVTALTTYAAALCTESILSKNAELSKALERPQRKEAKARAVRKCRWAMAAAGILNFGFLVVLKYKGLIFSGLSALGGLFGIEVPDISASILFPIGVSFYTFQSMGYVFDVYRGKVRAERNPLRLLLFVSFFPQIIQGPIARYGDLAEQLYEGHDFNYNNAKFGAQLIVWGAFKKLVIADRAAILVNTVFNSYPEYSGSVLAVAVMFYTVQIYTDFSGGIDIARGVAQIFGIGLEENFRRPYFAPTVAEFWRRWHITLGAWCRDYIFYPLSLSKPVNRLGKLGRRLFGNRVGKLIPVIFSQLVVFIIIGMWHGSQLKYIAFGLYHGAFIIGGILLEEPLARLNRRLGINTDSLWFRIFRILRTFAIVTFGRFFSRADSFLQSVGMMKDCFGPYQAPGLFTLGLSKREMLILAAALALLFVVSLMQERGAVIRERLAARPAPLRWAVYIAGVMSVILLGVYGPKYDASSFIYMGF